MFCLKNLLDFPSLTRWSKILSQTLQVFNGIVLPNILLESLNYPSAPLNPCKHIFTLPTPQYTYIDTKFMSVGPDILYLQFSKHALLCDISFPLEIFSAWNFFLIQRTCLTFFFFKTSNILTPSLSYLLRSN